VTKEEKICHTTYVTEYEPIQEQICEENYEKKCSIVTVDVDVDETVKTCMKPLQRVCNDGPTETVHRIKRDTLSTHLKSITDLLDETLENPRRISAGSARSLIQRQLQVNHSDQECRIYFETICTNKDNVDIFDKDCERIPVRLCAEGCIIKEGEVTCKTMVNKATSRRVPEEKCEIVPQTVCRTVTKLVPQLFPKEYCQTNPKELCQLKFTPNLNLPSIQPIIQRYCLAGRVLEYITDEDTNLIEDVKDQLELEEDGSGDKKDVKESNEDTIIDSVHEPRKLDDTPSDFNEFKNIQDKEDIEETLKILGEKEERVMEETHKVELTTIQPAVTETLSDAPIITNTELFAESTTEAEMKIDISLAPFVSIEKEDKLSTNSENILTTQTNGITFFSEETTTELPLTVSREDIEANELTAASIENMTTEPSTIQEMDTKDIVIGENQPEPETTITPEILTIQPNNEKTPARINEEEAEDKTLSKQYRNIVPIKVGYLPSLAGKGRSNDVLSGYDKYKNEVIKKQPKPSYGVLKPIKSISPTTLSTTVSTISASKETTIIDGFTIPKTKTTVKSKSYADIQPKALVPLTDVNLPNDINTITETVKKIIAEEISSEHQPKAAAQKQIVSTKTTITSTDKTTTMAPESISTERITSNDEVTNIKDDKDKIVETTTIEPTQSEILSATTDMDITTVTFTGQNVAILSSESGETTTAEQPTMKQDQLPEEKFTTIDLEEAVSTETPMYTTAEVKSVKKSLEDNLTNTIEEEITTKRIDSKDNEETTTITINISTFSTEVDQAEPKQSFTFSTSEDSTSEQVTTMQPSLEVVTNSEIKQSSVEIGETTTENASPKFKETTIQIATEKLIEEKSSSTEAIATTKKIEQFSTQKPTTLQPLTTKLSTSTQSAEITDPSASTTQPITSTVVSATSTTVSSKITTDKSMSTRESSLITTEPSVSRTESSMITTEPSTSTKELPIMTTDPSTSTKELYIKTKDPSTSTKELSIITTHPSTSTKELSIMTTHPSISTKELSIMTTEPSTSTKELPIMITDPSISPTKESSTSTTKSTTKSTISENVIDVDSKSKLKKSPRKTDDRKLKRSKFNIIRPISTFHIKPQQNQNAIKSIPELLFTHLNKKSEGQLRRTGGLLDLLYN